MTTLRIGGVPEHFNLPWYIALEKGYFEPYHIQVKWTDYPGGTGAMAKDLRSGDLDMAVLLTEGIVADIVKGNKSKIVQVYVESPLIWGIHVPAASGFQTADELRGKRYAVSRMGSGSHLMACVDATQRGWNPQEQELVMVGDLNGAREAFRKGEADAFMWEKFMTKPLVDAGEFRRVGEVLTPWPCFVVAVRNEVLENQLPAVQQVLAVVNKCCEEFMQNPEAVKLVSEKFHLQPEDAATWFTSTRCATESTISDTMLQTVADTLSNLQVITGSVNPTDLYKRL